MGFTGVSKWARGRRASSTAQLGAVARRLLVELLKEERRMTAGTPEEQLLLRNEGIPWNLPTMAERVGAMPASVSRALSGLEDRRAVACWSSGSGTARRVKAVKLGAEALRAAEAEELHPGETLAQRERRDKRAAVEWREERDKQWHEERC